jgi:hypothetical protein
MWEGCDTPTLLKLLADNRFRVDAKLAYIPMVCSLVSYINTFLRFAERGIYGRRIDETEIKHPPLFVMGHWRTGTTLLHELLILDPQHTSPDTHACLLPHHPLLSQDFFKRYLSFLMPGKRPMDNMSVGWERPQEDEFALALLGVPSTYRDIAFPNEPQDSSAALTLDGLTARQRREWSRALLRFIKTLNYRDPRRLVLKSPTHTARLPHLLKLFPDAKFIHITRNPYVLFSSTLNLWTSMAKKHGFQAPRRPDLIREKVLREFKIVMGSYLQHRSLIPADRLVELRYESFVKEPITQLADAYQRMSLPGWDAAKPRIEDYLASQAKYETNRYELSADDRAIITREWGDLIRQLGYSAD